jgi:hypothetical protein
LKAVVLGMSERHFRRLRDRYEAERVEGLVDRRLGRASGRGVACVATKASQLSLGRTTSLATTSRRA